MTNTNQSNLDLQKAINELLSIYSSDDGICLKPDPTFKEQYVVNVWAKLRKHVGIADDLK